MTVKWEIEVQMRNPVDDSILSQMLLSISRFIAGWPIVIKIDVKRIDA